jgi:hypothetical protein
MSVPDLRWRFTPSITEWLCLAAGSLLVYCYAWLMDDAYVYFRYVDNFVLHGQGLVWNPGEYVEGFSSPIWALLLSSLRSLGLNYWMIIRGMGLISFLAFWWLGCLVNRGLMTSTNGRIRSFNIPLVYLTFTYGVLCYFTSGLEAPLANLFAAVYVAAVLWPQNLELQVLVGISPLVRQEFLLPCLIFLTYAFAAKKCRPYVAILTLFISVGSYELFRVWYYADLFPNTYYLKDLTWIKQGIFYLYDAFMPYQTVPYLLAALLVYFTLKKAGKDELLTTERLVMLALAVPIIAYVVKIGGDPRHFRYLAFSYIVMVLATGGLMEKALPQLTKRAELALVSLVAVFGLAVMSDFPRQMDNHPLLRIPMKDVNHQVHLIGDAAVHRLRVNQLTPLWSGSSRYLSVKAARERYETERTQKIVMDTQPLGEVVKGKWIAPGKTLSGLPILSDSWCQNGFLHAALPVIHNLGLSEPFLARTRMASDRPAHKYGLRPLSLDMLRIRSEYGFVPGAFDRAITEDTNTASWIRENIVSIRKIERKAYNNHNLLDNIGLALTPVETIIPRSDAGDSDE